MRFTVACLGDFDRARIKSLVEEGLESAPHDNETTVLQAKSRNSSIIGKLKSAQNSVLVRKLASREKLDQMFAQDKSLVDSDSGRKTALIYLSQGSEETLDSQNEQHKILGARFINPQSASDVVILDPGTEKFSQDLMDLLSKFDSVIRYNDSARFSADDTRAIRAFEDENLDRSLQTIEHGFEASLDQPPWTSLR